MLGQENRLREEKKNTSKWPILVDMNLGYPTLKGPERQTVDTRSISVLILKSYGHDGSNGLCGRSVASKMSAHCFNTFFPCLETESGEKVNLLVERSVPEVFQQEKSVPTESLRTEDSEKVFGLGSGASVYQLKVRPMGRVTKDKRCHKAKTLHQFQSNS